MSAVGDELPHTDLLARWAGRVDLCYALVLEGSEVGSSKLAPALLRAFDTLTRSDSGEDEIGTGRTPTASHAPSARGYRGLRGCVAEPVGLPGVPIILGVPAGWRSAEKEGGEQREGDDSIHGGEAVDWISSGPFLECSA